MIGCGFFAVNQMHGWRDADGAEIVAICDRDPERLKIVGDQFGIERRYADAAEMMPKEKLDFVDIATTVNSHRALVELAASHKLPTICQKPFAPTLADAKAMVEACRKAGVPLMVHENFRWQSPIQAVKAVIDSGEIGEPFFGRISFRSGFDVFSGQPYLAEGKRFIIEDLGIHILDIARFLFGDVTTLTARTRRDQSRDQGRGCRHHAARPRERHRHPSSTAAMRRNSPSSRFPKRWSRSTEAKARSGWPRATG